MKQKGCIIVDDDREAIDVLKDIATQKNLDRVTCFTNPLEARAKIPDLAIDLAFMDIKLRELLKRINANAIKK